MRFTSSPDVEYWGYKFTVRALSVHVNDADALRGRNMELGAWLLDALLTRAPVAVRESYLGVWWSEGGNHGTKTNSEYQNRG